jgi:hypothetical protein
MKKNRFRDVSPKEWEDYRIRYSWKPAILSENKNLKRFEMNIIYFNGEVEAVLRPWIDNVPLKDRAVPKEMTIHWETGKGEAFEGRAFFNWQTANEAFKKSGGQQQLEFKIAPDNSSFELLLNNEPFKADSLRVYKSELTFKDSYK